jgi:hypothetical protein
VGSRLRGKCVMRYIKHTATYMTTIHGILPSSRATNSIVFALTCNNRLHRLQIHHHRRQTLLPRGLDQIHHLNRRQTHPVPRTHLLSLEVHRALPSGPNQDQTPLAGASHLQSRGHLPLVRPADSLRLWGKRVPSPVRPDPTSRREAGSCHPVHPLDRGPDADDRETSDD